MPTRSAQSPELEEEPTGDSSTKLTLPLNIGESPPPVPGGCADSHPTSEGNPFKHSSLGCRDQSTSHLDSTQLIDETHDVQEIDPTHGKREHENVADLHQHVAKKLYCQGDDSQNNNTQLDVEQPYSTLVLYVTLGDVGDNSSTCTLNFKSTSLPSSGNIIYNLQDESKGSPFIPRSEVIKGTFKFQLMPATLIDLFGSHKRMIAFSQYWKRCYLQNISIQNTCKQNISIVDIQKMFKTLFCYQDLVDEGMIDLKPALRPFVDQMNSKKVKELRELCHPIPELSFDTLDEKTLGRIVKTFNEHGRYLPFTLELEDMTPNHRKSVHFIRFLKAWQSCATQLDALHSSASADIIQHHDDICCILTVSHDFAKELLLDKPQNINITPLRNVHVVCSEGAFERLCDYEQLKKHETTLNHVYPPPYIHHHSESKQTHFGIQITLSCSLPENDFVKMKDDSSWLLHGGWSLLHIEIQSEGLCKKHYTNDTQGIGLTKTNFVKSLTRSDVDDFKNDEKINQLLDDVLKLYMKKTSDSEEQLKLFIIKYNKHLRFLPFSSDFDGPEDRTLTHFVRVLNTLKSLASEATRMLAANNIPSVKPDDYNGVTYIGYASDHDTRIPYRYALNDSVPNHYYVDFIVNADVATTHGSTDTQTKLISYPA